MLPSGFPIDKLSATDRHKVEWFYGRYVEQYYGHYKYGHFLMAAYAAVPGLLTPDMLYKMWQNFNAYTWSGKPVTIHRISVADILLSPLCHEVGYELYEMHQDIRLAFLEWLNVEADTPERVRGFRPIKILADFLQEYYQRPNPGSQIWGEHYLETQQLDVLSFSKPEKVAALLKTRISNAARDKNETSLLRAIDAFTKTHKRLQSVPPARVEVLQEFQKESEWLEAGRALVQQHFDQFAGMLNTHKDLSNWVTEKQEGALPVKIERSVMTKLQEDAQPKLWALLVSMNEEDAALVEEGLEAVLPPDKRIINRPERERLNKSAILEHINKIADNVKPDDEVLIYFSCSSLYDVAGTRMIVSHGYGDAYVDGIGSYDLRMATDKINCKQILLVLDTPFAANDLWMSITPGSHRAILASCAERQSPHADERELIDDKKYSWFTYELVRQLKRRQGLSSLRTLMNNTIKGFESMPQVRGRYGEFRPRIRKEHAPQLIASPEMLDSCALVGNDRIVRIHTGLQQAGYSHDQVEGLVSVTLQNAIEKYKEDFSIHRDADHAALLREMDKRPFGRHERPILLLIFSDPHKKLKAITDEQEEIRRLLSPYVEMGDMDFVTLIDPDKKTLVDLLMNSEHRNRVELFYYSGLDEGGDMVLDDGVFSVFDLIPLLEFQRNMQVVFFNTCNSVQPANWVTQLAGCRALGGDGTVDDGYSAAFGVSFFKKIINQESWKEYEELPRTPDNRMEDAPQGAIRYFQPSWMEKGELMPWKFKKVEVKEEPFNISFDQRLNSWVANVGLQDNLRTTFNFTGTYFLLQDGAVALIRDVQKDQSLLYGLDGRDTTQRFGATLVRGEVPEVKVTFEKLVSNSTKQAIREEIERYDAPFIDLVDVPHPDHFLIQENEPDIYLTQGLQYEDERPAFTKVESAKELVMQLQCVSEWRAMLNYVYPGKNIAKEDIEITFLVAEDLKDKPISEMEFSAYRNPASLLIERNNGQYPAVKFKVSIAEESKLETCHVHALYFDRGFDVHDISAEAKLLRKGDAMTIGIDSDIIDRIENSATRPDKHTDKGEQSLPDYVRLFVSTTPALTSPLKHFGWRGSYSKVSGSYPVNADLSVTVPVYFNWGEEVVNPEQTFRQRVEELYDSISSSLEDDPQKNRWGGEPAVNKWMLHASVKRKNLIPGFYSITIYADFKGDIPPDTEVAFFLHDSFDDEIKYTTVEKGRALITVSAYEAFTVAAYTSDGTMLELDLNNVPGFPDGFYYKDVMDSFKEKVKELYNSTPVRTKDDLQKGRWGGAFHVNGKALSARVKKSALPGFFKIKLKVASTNNTPLTGDVAFFIHDSFNNQIKFRRALNGEASVSITAYEAFAVGAYTEDGTFLELDLNQVKDAPEGFYYKDDRESYPS